jgi:hypothetical protein
MQIIEHFLTIVRQIELLEYILIAVNLAAGFGCAVLIARMLGRARREGKGTFRYFVIAVGVYFVECVAIAMGMGIPVFSMGMAFVWGIIFGWWLRGRGPAREVLRQSFFLSLYSSLPALSFVVIPVLWSFGGPVLSVAEGADLGIPGFVPWPLNTILGFYVIPAVCAAVFKILVTTSEVSLLIHLGEKSTSEGG